MTTDRSAGDWATQQLAEFLAAVSAYPDEPSAIQGAIEHTAEALEAEIGAVVVGGSVVSTVGFSSGQVPDQALVELADERPERADVSGIGACHVAIADLDDELGTSLVIARSGEEPFDPDECTLLRSMAQVLTLTLRTLRTLDEERALRSSLQERQKLLERLTRIQRSISHRAPLQEVLDAITNGCQEVLGDDIAGLRLIDRDDPGSVVLVSVSGVSPELAERIRKGPVGEGAGGRAIAEQRLCVVENYESAPEAVPALAAQHLQAAMAAPVFEDGEVVGSLVVASYDPARRFSDSEREMLLALAEHASLALTDAKTVDAMREAQRSKEMFLAMVSHELKTPLTVIMASLQTLRTRLDRLAPDVRDELLALAWSRGEDLRRLIDMLLEGARAELAATHRAAHLPALLEDAVAGFDSSREVLIGDVPRETMSIDVVGVRRTLGVLIENAVAHSPPGTRICVGCELSDGELAITVENAGALPDGMGADDLFTPFQRGPEARSSGIGLGLYLASRLAASMGGRIEAHSREGTVVFTLRLPARRGEGRSDGADHDLVRSRPAP